jgi:hypothetical protein
MLGASTSQDLAAIVHDVRGAEELTGHTFGDHLTRAVIEYLKTL